MKTIVILLFCLIQVQVSCGQRKINNLVQPKASQVNIVSQMENISTYDFSSIDKKLKSAHRLTLAGTIVTATSGALFVSGVIVLFCVPNRPVTSPTGDTHRSTYGGGAIPAICMWGTSLGVFSAGFPVLITGICKHRKWERIKNQATGRAGLLNDGALGVALNF